MLALLQRSVILSDITVVHSPDRLKAFLTVSELRRDKYPGAEELRLALVAYGVVEGIRGQVLEHMYRQRACSRRTVVAEGIPAQQGTPAELKPLIDTSVRGKPKELDGGRVDHRDLQQIINVRAGQPLLKRIPPGPGVPGRTIFGEEIKPPPAQDISLRIGVGTKVLESDANVLVAAIDGAVKISPDGSVEVHGAKIVRGDIDYTTGNISFVGSLRITGTVRSGFAVKAEGDLGIIGSVEDARVECTGNLEIGGGAVGSQHGELVCGGAVKAHHVEGFTVRAQGDVTVVEDAVHCTIESEGTVRAKTIMGGSVLASGGVDAGEVGATAETRTVLDMGGVFRLRLLKENMVRKMGHLAMDLAAKKHEMFTLVSEGMDDAGDLSPDRAADLIKLKKGRTALRTEHANLTREIERVEGKLENAPRPVIKAKHMFPNTVVRFGPLERTVKEELRNVVVSATEDKIIFSSSAKAG